MPTLWDDVKTKWEGALKALSTYLALSMFLFEFFFNFCWSIVDLPYVMLLSAVQQSDSVIHIHISTLF